MSPDVAGPSNRARLGHELLLARALDARLASDRAGSRSGVEGESLPSELRIELESLVGLVGLIRETAGSVRADDDFRGAARTRLLAQIRTAARDDGSTLPVMLSSRLHEGRDPERKLLLFPLRRATPWLARVAAAFFAVILVGGGTLTASANALPGDALYGVKQASEALTLQLASDDVARARAYLAQAEARLEELTRLLEQGRETEAATTASRYDAVRRSAADHAASADHGAPGAAESASASATLDEQLAKHEARIAAIIAAAPLPAREALERALLTPNHGRERSREVRQALSEGDLPGRAEPFSVRQGDEPRGANAGTGTTPAAVTTATSNQRSDDASSERRGREERPAVSATSSSLTPRGPRDELRVGPGYLTQDEDDTESPVDGAAREEQGRVRPPVLRTPTASREDDRRRTAPRESPDEPRGRSGSSGPR